MQMVKRRHSLFMSIVIMTFLFTTSVQAAPLVMQGEIVQGRFLVPMRAIFVALGAEVDWDAQTSTITGFKEGISVKLVVNKQQAHINDHSIPLDVAPTIVNNRTFVPARFVSDALGAEIDWDSDKNIATITMKNTVIKVYQSAVKDFYLDQEGPIYLSVGETKSVAAIITGEGLSFEEEYPRWGTSDISVANVSGTVISGYTNTLAGVTERFIVTANQAVYVKGISPGEVTLSAAIGPYPDIHQPQEINRSQIRQIRVIVRE